MKYTLKASETTTQLLSNPKPLSSSNNTTASTNQAAAGSAAVHHSPTNSDTSNLCYEPTSVLDIRGSPSSAAVAAVDLPTSSTAGIPPDVLSDDLPLQWDDNSEDWDKLLTGLGLTVPDDSVTGSRASAFPQLALGPSDAQLLLSPVGHPEFPPSAGPQFADFGGAATFVPSDLISLADPGDLNGLDLPNNSSGITHWNVGFDFVDELIRAAECVDSNELQLAQGILARLNQRLPSPAGKPLQRAAFYFKEALHSLLTGSNRPVRPSSSSEIVQTIRTYKAFSGISPIPMFSHFTANQALLEAVDGSALIHVIDFDIGLGGKWASFMREVVDRSEICRVNPPVLRISAVVPEEFAAESRLIGDSLSQFARELRLGFHIEFVLTRSFDVLSFNAIKFIDGERTAVNLSPATFTRLSTSNSVAGFLSNLRRLSPRVVVFVDGDGWADAGTPSFRRNFINGLEFYSTMMESLDATSSGEWVRRIEMHLVRPKIFAAVEAAAAGGGGRVAPWKELLAGAGLRAVQLSQFADFQADCLLGKAQVKGFHVAKRHGEMVLCWHDRPLVATSSWRC